MTSVADQVLTPGAVMAVDLVGPSKLFAGGVALTTIDLFSRYPTATLLKNGSGKEVAAALQQVFSLLGAPSRIISDNGLSFRSKELENLLRRYNITHSYSSIYYPQANAVVERMHRTLKSRLQKTQDDNPQIPVVNVLSEVLADMRSTPCETTGETPFYRFFGREMRTKLTTLQRECRLQVSRRPNANRYLKKNGYSSHYEVGDRVWLRRGKGNPFSYRGVISSRVKSGTYNMTLEDGGQRVINQYHLRPRSEHQETVPRGLWFHVLEEESGRNDQGNVFAPDPVMQAGENQPVVVDNQLRVPTPPRRNPDRASRHRKPARFR